VSPQRPSLLLLPAATQQIKQQAAYYRDESGDKLAHRWRAAVNDTIRTLRTMPQRGTPCHFRHKALTGIHRVFVEGFPKQMVLYRYTLNPCQVEVVAVLHGARELESALLSPTDEAVP
jgi:plasmid stabilization system protein ParE